MARQKRTAPKPPLCKGRSACRETRHAQKGQHSRTNPRVARVSPLWNPLSTKFYGKPRTRRKTPRTQFAEKFPCLCRHHRHTAPAGAFRRPTGPQARLLGRRCPLMATDFDFFGSLPKVNVPAAFIVCKELEGPLRSPSGRVVSGAD